MSHLIEYGLQLNTSAPGGFTTADLDAMRAAGARWVRINCDMAYAWPTSTTYTNDTPDWEAGASETLMTYAKSIGLKVLAMTGFTPSWMLFGGGSYPACPPDDFDQWATMCARAYRDLSGVVDCWEIWNEANLVQFWADPTTNTNNYRTLLRKVVNAMRFQAASTGSWHDPFIITSGLASTGSGSAHWTDRWDRGSNPASQDGHNVSMGTFYDRLFDATNGIVAGTTINTPYVNGYGAHCYIWGTAPPLHNFFENPLKRQFDGTNIPVGAPPFSVWDDIICVEEGYTDPANPPTGHKKIWCTENGYPGTDGLYTTFGTAAEVAAKMDQAWTWWEFFGARGAGPMFHFMLRDSDVGDEVEQYGGLYDVFGGVKPIRNVYRSHATSYVPSALPSGVVEWSDPAYYWSDPRVTWDGGIIGTNPPATPDGSSPVFKIEIGIPPKASQVSNAFVLNDSSRGKLNNGTYVLAPEFNWIDVTGSAYEVDTWRGRNRELDRTDTGTCTVGIWNNRQDLGTARHYDPDNWLSPFFPYLQPWRSKIRVTIDDVIVYTGWLDDWTVSEPQDGVSFAQFNAVDAFAKMARDVHFVPKAVQKGDARLKALLDRAEWYGQRYITAGEVDFMGKPGAQDGSILDRIFEVVQAELGMAYISPAEVFVFLSRAVLEATSPVLELSDNPSDPIRYSSFDRQSGAELLYNSVTVTRSGAVGDDEAVPQSFTNKQSEAEFGLRPLDYSFPVATDDDCLPIAYRLLGRYQNPTTRFRTVTIPTAKYSQDTRRDILNLELGQAVRVIRTPVGGGAPSTLSQVCTVIGISHRGEPRQLETTLTLQRKV